jgi:hypothetical protein
MQDIGGLDENQGTMMSLREIASWPPFSESIGELPSVVAGIPSLQRGLVWRAGQVELMWDSLARGFPIGSLVVCPKLAASQVTRQVSTADDDRVTHHLLDGQQRAQAIRLGFVDPFDGKPDATLWLDLAPGKPGGTRAFRFRVTTKAHPWGYAAGDTATRLPVEKIRKSLERCGFDPFDSDFEKRPVPSACWPIESVAPVPVAWLMGAEDDTDDALAANVKKKCADLLGTKPHGEWIPDVTRALADPLRQRDLQAAWAAVRRLRRTLIAVLSVPQAVLSETLGGSAADSPVALAETMFQRLNGGGTPLDGDELAYSMIKAHWPEIEARVDTVAAQRKLPEARLVTLAARIPMADGEDASDTILSRVNVDAIRKLAVGVDSTSDKPSKRDRFKTFFLGSGQFGFEPVLAQVAKWGASSDAHALPVVLQTTLARSTPDVYALLLWMAHRALRDGTAEAPGVGRRVQSVLTSLAWFAPDHRRAAAAVAAVLDKQGPLREESFKGLLADAYQGNESVLRLPPSPNELEQLLPEPRGNPGEWGLWNKLTGDQPIQDSARRIALNRDMLIYAQRSLLKEKFSGYDPSRKDLWADHDRPWDFDHLLANESVTYRSNLKGLQKDVLWDWSKRCIANLRAWPFAHNRGDGSAEPAQKFRDGNLPKGMDADEAMRLSFLNEVELAGFDAGFKFSGGGDEDSLRAFADGARARLLRIYREWHDAPGLDIGYLKQLTSSD